MRNHILRAHYRRLSTTRPVRDLATCQLLGTVASTPTTFSSKAGAPGVRYLLVTNYGTKDNPQSSWFNISSFNESAIEALTKEDLKGSRVLVNGNLEVRSRKHEVSGAYTEAVYIKQTSIHFLERPRRRKEDVPDEATQKDALEDSFSV